MYCSPVWHPATRRDVNALEGVQRRYTKCISGLREMDYHARLNELKALSLENLWKLADMSVVYNCLNNRMNCTAIEMGLILNNNNRTRRSHFYLNQKITKHAYSSYFCNRAPTEWNKLSLSIINSPSLNVFKQKLSKALLLRQ